LDIGRKENLAINKFDAGGVNGIGFEFTWRESCRGRKIE